MTWEPWASTIGEEGGPMEIASHIHAIPVPSPQYIPVRRSNVYLLLSEEAALIDAGQEEDAPARLEYLKGLGL